MISNLAVLAVAVVAVTALPRPEPAENSLFKGERNLYGLESSDGDVLPFKHSVHMGRPVADSFRGGNLPTYLYDKNYYMNYGYYPRNENGFQLHRSYERPAIGEKRWLDTLGGGNLL
ncbi:uncharacterized protein LOC106669325 isoform X2 [Cimex lectularius]|uniref:CPR type cuticle protein n=1 Tax=Cimex lectularius TaxID=79782 RepID=A0A8I6RZE3_CIMLE|nr:uncharacterized protein LOC106669325 isoform X2 [Cimex lectularius]